MPKSLEGDKNKVENKKRKNEWSIDSLMSFDSKPLTKKNSFKQANRPTKGPLHCSLQDAGDTGDQLAKHRIVWLIKWAVNDCPQILRFLVSVALISFNFSFHSEQEVIFTLIHLDAEKSMTAT